MSIKISAGNFKLTAKLKNHIQRKANVVLSRLGSHVKDIAIYLNDTNGAGGGVDKHCLISLSLVGQDNLIISETQADIYQAIDRAMQRAAQTATLRITYVKTSSRHRRGNLAKTLTNNWQRSTA